MKILATTTQQANDYTSIDGIPLADVSGGVIALVPVIGWAIVFVIREMVKIRVEQFKAKYQAEIEEHKAQAKLNADLIEELRGQNRMFTREILNLNQAMENSGPLIDSPSEIRKKNRN